MILLTDTKICRRGIGRVTANSRPRRIVSKFIITVNGNDRRIVIRRTFRLSLTVHQVRVDSSMLGRIFLGLAGEPTLIIIRRGTLNHVTVTRPIVTAAVGVLREHSWLTVVRRHEVDGFPGLADLLPLPH